MSLATLADKMPTPLGPPPMIAFTPVARKPRTSRTPRVTREPSLQGDASGQVKKGPKEPRGPKVSFYLTPEVIRQLKLAAAVLDSDMSQVVQEILAASPALNWVIYNRGKSDDQAMVEVSSDHLAKLD